jgi:hypothetical protein
MSSFETFNAPTAADPVGDTTVRLADELRLLQSLPAIWPDARGA